MRVRIAVRENWGGVSLRSGQLGEPGREYEVPDDECAALCAAGVAEPVDETATPPVETATAPVAAVEKRPAPVKRGQPAQRRR